MALNKFDKILGKTFFVVFVLLLNGCFNINLPPGNITNCQLALNLIISGIDASNYVSQTEEDIKRMDNLIAYYASHCDGTESKKHKRKKKNDPIYNLSGKEDKY
ncbi:hypothetical protein [Leptospira interrogans]|uniref:hypothetical protein n=1 Tax=Leptospira interrogans TaxID=173 RepID=UPI0002BC4994|nr:hypothetical protein [Leptospira interrogans]